MQEAIGIRRNIQMLSKGERQQYFWCLKFLGIIPANPRNRERYFHSLAPPCKTKTCKEEPCKEEPCKEEPCEKDPCEQNKINPRSIHEQLIANHATCCQHGSYYFLFYHRHLMVYLQLMLNYAHELLSDPQQFATQYPELYKDHKEKFDNVFDEYKDIKDKAQKVMAHYWNPTNYNNNEDLVIPLELSDPLIYDQHLLDKMGVLYNSVKGYYVYEINVKNAMYKNSANFCSEAFIQQNKDYFNPMGENPSKEHEQLMKGILNARTHQGADFETKFLKHFQDYQSLVEPPASNGFNIQCARNYKKFTSSSENEKNKMNLFNSTADQSLAVYGGRKNRMQYFNLKQLDSECLTKCLTGAQISYNQLLPHYQLGHAIYSQPTKRFTKYIDPKVALNNEWSHNTMHNMAFFSMIDGNFSLLNLMFFPYHSWIDIQLEMRLRMDKKQQSGQVQKFLKEKKKFQNVFDFILSGQNSKPTFGDYPILQWANPQIKQIYSRIVGQKPLYLQKELFKALAKFNPQKDLIQVFNAQQMMIRKNSKGNCQMRDSRHLHELYYQKYIKPNLQKYKNFKGFSNYNASYDYEIFQTIFTEDQKLINKSYILDENASNIPQYLQEMKEIVCQFPDQIKKRVQAARIQFDIPQQDLKKLLALINRNMFLFVQYSSNTRNGSYPIQVNFKKLIKECKQFYNPFSPQEEEAFSKNFNIFNITVFGKGNKAQQCINCGQSKTFFLDFGQQLYRRNAKLWRYVSQLLHGSKVYFDSTNIIPQTHQRLIQDFVEVSIQSQQKFKDKFIHGAGQLTFQLEQNITAEADKIDMQVNVDISNFNNGKMWADNPPQKLNQVLHFEKVTKKRLCDDENEAERFDLRTYKKVKGTVTINNLSKEFEFSIKNYHKLLNFKVIAQIIDKNLQVRVEDKDYSFKKAFLSIHQ